MTRIFRPIFAALCATLLLGAVPSFEGGGRWLNSPALSAKNLSGKVVLVDFWEYTCIN
jgi:hypothetical protein